MQCMWIQPWAQPPVDTSVDGCLGHAKLYFLAIVFCELFKLVDFLSGRLLSSIAR